MIALIDYGAGNLTSVRKGFAAAGAELFTPADPSELTGSNGIVVPGVGHFGATAALDGGWTEAIRRAAGLGTPLLGICLGMQWLFEGSEEAPGVGGLGAIAGVCSRLPRDESGALKVPHVGWNSLHAPRSSRLLDGIEDGSQVYFTHSVRGSRHGAVRRDVHARTDLRGGGGGRPRLRRPVSSREVEQRGDSDPAQLRRCRPEKGRGSC